MESCRIVADLARLAAYDAILSPSAALAGARNMCFQMPNEIDPLHVLSGTQAFADHRLSSQVFFRARAICLEHELNGFPQIGARFLKGVALRIGAGQFLDEGNVAPALRRPA